MIPAQGSVKNYHWGKVGDDSYIARFQKVADQHHSSGASTDHLKSVKSSDTPLAELWFGSHPSGPATVYVDKQHIRLDTFLAKHPEMVGAIDHYHKYDKKLPFLFKILSIAQPLSLQAHPDKKLAVSLHRDDPKNYPDSNHKPELAIALTDLEVLCDFRPKKEIADFMKILPPLRSVAGDKNCEHYSKLASQDAPKEHLRASLADCFKTLMTSDKELIKRETKNLLLISESVIGNDLHKLICNLDKLYPGDPGIFAPFFLNYMKLTPGQALYIRANKLHAYLKGECIECMACSDNVIRAGLTTKYRDVKTLINMLDYESVKDNHDIFLTGEKCGSAITSYSPTSEFKIDKIVLSHTNVQFGEYTLAPLLSGSFIIVVSGKASAENFFDLKVEHKLQLGSAGFIPPKIALRLTQIQGTLVIYRSYC